MAAPVDEIQLITGIESTMSKLRSAYFLIQRTEEGDSFVPLFDRMLGNIVLEVGEALRLLIPLGLGADVADEVSDESFTG
jgi:hypothetical protein